MNIYRTYDISSFGKITRKPLVLAPMCCNCLLGVPCDTLAPQFKGRSEALQFGDPWSLGFYSVLMLELLYGVSLDFTIYLLPLVNY